MADRAWIKPSQGLQKLPSELRRGLSWAAGAELVFKSPLKASLSQSWWTGGTFSIHIMQVVALGSDILGQRCKEIKLPSSWSGWGGRVQQPKTLWHQHPQKSQVPGIPGQQDFLSWSSSALHAQVLLSSDQLAPVCPVWGTRAPVWVPQAKCAISVCPSPKAAVVGQW